MTTSTFPAPDTGPAPAQASKNIELLTWTRANLNRASTQIILLSAVFGLGEAITAQTALLTIVRNTALSWTLAIIVVTAANFAAYTAGVKWHTSKPAAAVLAAGWIILGAVLAYLRLHHAALDTPDTTFGTSANELAADTAAATANDQLQAALLLAVFFVGGTVIFWKAHGTALPALLGHINATEQATAATAARDLATAEHTQASAQLAKRYAEIDDTNTDLARQKTAIAHTIALAQQHARQRIAELLKDARHTSGVHTPIRPGTHP
jgi:hypothetical protein